MSKEKEARKQQEASPESGISTAGKYVQSEKELQEDSHPDLLQEGMEVAQTDADLTTRAKHHKSPPTPTIDPAAFSHLAELDHAALSDTDFLHWLEANQSLDPDLLRAEINRRTGHDANGLGDVFTVAALRMFFAPIKSDDSAIHPDILQVAEGHRRDFAVPSEVSSVSGESENEERRTSLVHMLHLDRRARRIEKVREELREAVEAEKADMDAWEVRIRERHERRVKRRAERAAKKTAELSTNQDPLDHSIRLPGWEVTETVSTPTQTIQKTAADRSSVDPLNNMHNLQITVSEDSATNGLLPDPGAGDHRDSVSETDQQKDLSLSVESNVMETVDQPRAVITADEYTVLAEERSPEPEVVKQMQKAFPEGFLSFHSPAQERLRQRLKPASI